jgi:hypothetical protein
MRRLEDVTEACGRNEFGKPPTNDRRKVSAVARNSIKSKAAWALMGQIRFSEQVPEKRFTGVLPLHKHGSRAALPNWPCTAGRA